ncbi:hypothetical protein ACFYNW_17505 [Streptomyces virginiae]|uniref:hypothetical protein n=1 Tax=Streptomyces virginiae TaxID=1961 RepID=UPI0036EB2C9C
MDAATFSESATVDVSAREVSFRKARFDGPATVHVRYANVDLTEARLAQPMMVASTQAVLSRSDSVDTAPEALLAFGRYEKTASILSLRAVP